MTQRSDRELEREFRQKVRADSQLGEYRVNCEVKNGDITLTGQVPDQQLRTKADAIAKTIAGVKMVRNNIEIGGREKELKKASDDQLRNELEEKIQADSELKEMKLDVEVQNGKAVISGNVPSPELQQKVNRLAQTVTGLQTVDNKVNVQQMGAAKGEAKPKVAVDDRSALPGQRSDSAMSMEMRMKLLVDSQLNGYDIDVEVNDGIIALVGAVPSDEMRRKAERLAKTVSGARDVKVSLNVTNEPMPPAEKRSDTGMKSELKAKLMADSELSGWRTGIDVNDGIATISGEVDNERLKKKATELAETVAGLRQIRNDLRVMTSATERSVEDGQGGGEKARIGDAEISRKLQERYATEPQMRGASVRVDVKKGIATLEGEVRSEEQKQMAERIARQTDGVREVKNRLAVKPEGK